MDLFVLTHESNRGTSRHWFYANAEIDTAELLDHFDIQYELVNGCPELTDCDTFNIIKVGVDEAVFIGNTAELTTVVCESCGREDGLSTAAQVEWSVATQSFEVVNVYDKGHNCEHCGNVYIKKVPLSEVVK